MKIASLEQVNKLIEIKETCVTARASIEEYITELGAEKDSGGVDGFDYGYWATFSQHNDGSGFGSQLNGCYIGVQVAEHIEEELNNQIKKIDVRLSELGVKL